MWLKLTSNSDLFFSTRCDCPYIDRYLIKSITCPHLASIPKDMLHHVLPSYPLCVYAKFG